MSKTAPVENEHSSLDSQAAMAAISPTSTNRPIGILPSMLSIWLWAICSNIEVLATAGVIALTSTPRVATSLASDFVRAIRPALLALYWEAFGLQRQAWQQGGDR